jgi:hypothetical protein
MREKKGKKKANPYLIFTILFLVGIFASFIIKTIYFTPKETIINIDQYEMKTTKRTEKDVTKLKPTNEEEKKLNYRNNWKDFISIGTLHKEVEYMVSPDGRITNLNIPLINKTDYPIESITIKVYYINPDNKNTLESRSFEIKNILPGQRVSYPGPESNVKGVTIFCEIAKIRSSNFSFCYDQDLLIDANTNGGFNGNPTDPWHCK